MKHGFIKLAAGIPRIRVGSPIYNAGQIIALIEKAYRSGTHVLTLPELCLTGYTCGDLFFTEKLLRDTETALLQIREATRGVKMLTFVGAPLRCGGKLYDCAVAVSDGEILGAVPKTAVAGCGESCETRYFAAASEKLIANPRLLNIGDAQVPFPTLLYTCGEVPSLTVGCAIGDDLSAPAARLLAEQGAVVLVNPAAEAEILGREDWRRTAAKAVSGKLCCACVTAGAGETESTTDMVFGGHCLIAENGVLKAENPPFGPAELTCAVTDIQHLHHDRMRRNTFAGEQSHPTTAAFSLDLRDTDLTGVIAPSPFLPETEADRAPHCAKILEIQSRGLAGRLSAAHASGAVIALSGGLDSTLALIVTVRAADLLGWDREKILSVTMPCFGTTSRTRGNAEELAVRFGTAFRCIDIKAAVDQHFRDIGHDENDLSVVYENAQARERTQIIMDLANGTNALVIGTGDLSELALGWATYNGDHMSNYGVNGGVPKTLVRHVVAWYANLCETEGKPALAAVLRDILATPVSPELLPPKDGDIAQRTEDIVGPYDLHDFFLYHFVRWGEEPDKIRREAVAALGDRFRGDVIDGWLKIFLRRFFTQQFKRSALPDGPKVGSVGLSPRGDWRMPSDAAPWQAD